MTEGGGSRELERRLQIERRRTALWQDAYELLAGRRSVRVADRIAGVLAGLVGRGRTRARVPEPAGEAPGDYRWRLAEALDGSRPLRVALGAGTHRLRDAWPTHATVSTRADAASSADLLVLAAGTSDERAAARPIRVGLGAPVPDGDLGALDTRADVAGDPRATVHEIHTAARRWLHSQRFALAVGVPDEAPERWGDLHLARSLRAELRRRGYPTRVQLLDDWYGPAAGRDDVRIHLFGLTELVPHPDQASVMWHISHPDRLDTSQAEGFHLLAVASRQRAGDLASRLRVPVMPLLQAADVDRFRPTPGGPAHEVLFIGNTRGQARRAVQDLLPTSHDLAVYGAGWQDTDLPARYWRGEHVPNAELAGYYSAAELVVADHWQDMRRHGFISNRIYEVLACGTAVVSDEVAGLDDALDGVVPTYGSGEELRTKVDRLLARPDERRQIADAGRSIVLDRHTLAARVVDLEERLVSDGLLDSAPSTG